MPKRIVICPSFASSHFIKCHVPNLIEAINPDSIIYVEGMFPQGPENRGHLDSVKFNWTFSCKGRYGFDITITEDFCSKFDIVDTVGGFYKENWSADRCFLHAISRFEKIDIEIGDIIFPLEPDAFHREDDRDKIDGVVSALKPGEGLKTKWVDFLGTQYYTEAINIKQPKYRRFAYCFDNMPNYLAAMNGFTSQQYPKLKQCDEFITYHYPWFVYDKWKQLRYELIYRSDPQYWKDFDSGLNEIRFNSELEISQRTWSNRESYPKNKIVIRPSRTDESRWAQFIDINHPKAIQLHPNFIK